MDDLITITGHNAQQSLSEAEILGMVVWLWTHSQTHRVLPLAALNSQVYPVIRLGQYIVLCHANQPIAYAAWAALDERREQNYLTRTSALQTEQDWFSGNRYWITDFIAPFGHTNVLRHMIQSKLSGQPIRFLRHKGSDRGLKVIETHGLALLSEEARHWFKNNPVCYPNSSPV
jgi:cytolysin-activating lysine-acyltransferase